MADWSFTLLQYRDGDLELILDTKYPIRTSNLLLQLDIRKLNFSAPTMQLSSCSESDYLENCLAMKICNSTALLRISPLLKKNKLLHANNA